MSDDMRGDLHPTRARTRLAHRVWLIVILLLAFGLRMHQLDGQSMWSDEGLSYYRAQLSTVEVLANTITVDGVRTVDTNPPFYFLLLHAWRALIGESVFQLRLFGVFAGWLAVPLLYLLGSALWGRGSGLLAALFMAMSPLHVWQTQVLRNYGLLITLNLFAVYGLVRFLNGQPPTAPRARWLALWLAASLLGIYTHYFGFLIFAFTLVALGVELLRWQRERGLSLPRVLLAVALLATILAPALWAAFTRFRAGRQFDFAAVEAWGIVVQALSVFSVGMSPTLTHPPLWLVPALLLVSTGIFVAWRYRRKALMLVLGYQVIPLALLLLLSSVNPLINGTRHLLIGLPPFLLLCAAIPGIVTARPRLSSVFTRLALLLAFVIFAVQAIWLQRQFNHGDFVRDDVRGAAHYLSQMAAPEDTIVLHDSLMQFTFDAYYEGAAPVIVTPLYGQQDETAAIARLQNAAGQSGRIWFLTHPQPRTGFPRDRLLAWADDAWHRLRNIDFEWLWLPVRLRVYSVDPHVDALPPAATPQEARYENGLQLHGFEMPATLQSGAPFMATFYLSRQVIQDAHDENVEISLRFLDEAGRLWRQIDEPLWPAYPYGQWPAGSLLRYDLVTELPAGLPPGNYQVWLRLVNREANRNVPLAGGGVDVRLSDIGVGAATCEDVGTPWPTYRQDGVLFGRHLLLKGHTQAAERYLPGHLLSMDLLWCVRRAPGDDVQLQVQLVDAQGENVAQSQGPVTRPDFTVEQWQPDQLLQGAAQLPLPSSIEAGVYDLRLSVVDNEGQRPMLANLGFAGRSVTVEQIRIDEWPMETTFPPIATPFFATFGDPALIELHGYELGAAELAAGESTQLTLYWRAAVNIPTENYYTFVHVGQPGQTPQAQADGPPLNGFRLTSSWREGEVFVDERTITIPEDAVEGEYMLGIGFYQPDTFVRLPAFVDGQRQEQDVITLQPVTVVR